MKFQPMIKTKADYKAALEEIYLLVDKDPEIDTSEGLRLYILTGLIEDYEAKYHPENII